VKATARRGLAVAVLATGLLLCPGIALSRASVGAPASARDTGDDRLVPVRTIRPLPARTPGAALVPGPVAAGAVHPGPRTQALAGVVVYRHTQARLPFRVRVSVG
jgi:hypothetical protein